MKLIVFLIVAGCAVNCDETNNYFLVERPPDAPARGRPFQVYWNVPTMQCRSKRIPFDGLFERYGIVQNKDDSFLGEKVVILYDPGLFPAILMKDKSGKMRFRNGGVPQEGNLDEHLTAFRYSLEQGIPDPDFSGIAIIDFESWRPVFRQNFGELTPYKIESLKIESQLHPFWSKAMTEARAKYRFERSGREFMQATVKLARLLRPRARWGYYGFPYCFNMAANSPAEPCPDKVRRENDQISWLWSESSALFPSVYSSSSLSAAQLAALVRGRVAEAARLAKGLPVLPYFWFRYRDAGFMSEVDLKTALKTMYKSQASGFIIWGSSNDTNTSAKCEKLKVYVENILGPAVAVYTKQSLKIDEVDTKGSNDTSAVNVTTESPLDLIASESKDNPNVDEDSIQLLIINESNQNSTDDSPDEVASDSQSVNDEKQKEQSNSILIDILLSIIENVQKNENKEEMAKEMVKINKDRKKGTPLHDTFTKVSTENYFDTTTKNPFEKDKKKGELFTSLFTNSTTTEVNNITTTKSNIVTTDDEISTTTFTSVNGVTTNSESVTTTTEVWDDNNTFYNEDTFLDQEFSLNITLFTTASTETIEDHKSEYSLLEMTTEVNGFVVDSNENTTEYDFVNSTEFSISNMTTEKFVINLNPTENSGSATENVSTYDGTSEVITEKQNNTLTVVPADNQVVITIS